MSITCVTFSRYLILSSHSSLLAKQNFIVINILSDFEQWLVHIIGVLLVLWWFMISHDVQLIIIWAVGWQMPEILRIQIRYSHNVSILAIFFELESVIFWANSASVGSVYLVFISSGQSCSAIHYLLFFTSYSCTV